MFENKLFFLAGFCLISEVLGKHIFLLPKVGQEPLFIFSGFRYSYILQDVPPLLSFQFNLSLSFHMDLQAFLVMKLRLNLHHCEHLNLQHKPSQLTDPWYSSSFVLLGKDVSFLDQHILHPRARGVFGQTGER